jgi:hypothetical protein
LCMLRIYRTDTRPWWRHPRFHLHHWKIQIHALQDFKRWAFSRCAGCGRRFSWGYAPVTGQWNSEGPRWGSVLSSTREAGWLAIALSLAGGYILGVLRGRGRPTPLYGPSAGTPSVRSCVRKASCRSAG